MSPSASSPKFATKEIADCLVSDSEIIKSTAKMGQHLEDLGREESENREGKLLTVVDCYMKEYVVSRKEALSKFGELVEDRWKKVTGERVRKSSIPKEMVVQLLHYGRVAQVSYMNSIDHYTNPKKFMMPIIPATFVESIAI